jgi:PD-(D/E)XK nuclease superfamily
MLAPIVERLDPADTIAVSKHQLGTVFSCERRFLSDAPFVVSLANVRGTVFHRALERTINSPEPQPPLERARAAVEYCATTSGHELRWCQEFLRTLTPDEHHDLVRDVGRLVSAFTSDWPAIPTRWDPKVEFPLRARLAAGRVTLHGKPDLIVGRAQGATARSLIIDFKTGWVRPEHREDLRFYALLELLVRRMPPFRLVSYYPESGEPVVEDVTEGLLESAARRVVDGVDRIEALRARRRAPREVGNGLCRFCAELPTCATGTAQVAVAVAAAALSDPSDGDPDLDD